MAEISENRAAWQPEARATSLKVSAGPDQTNPQGNEVIIAVSAWAINPIDWKLQSYAIMPLEYPTVLGFGDVAGHVAKIGPDVTRFKVGDRVIGECVGMVVGGIRHAAYQDFAASFEPLVAKIPDSTPLEQAVVLPTALSTATCGLYEVLMLEAPTSTTSTTRKNQTVLIMGGASSVGATAAQLATAAGYDVINTASAKTLDFANSVASPIKNAGQVTAFDRADPNLADKIIDHIKKSGNSLVGAFDTIGVEETTLTAAAVVHAFGGGTVSSTLYPPEKGMPEDVKHVMVGALGLTLKPGHPGLKVWKDYVPEAIAAGTLKLLPKALIIEGGLDKIQEGLNVSKKGVSALKVVVRR